mmetsp:Transcript_20637/g.30691  ORF Transcript_20637/g.30691 Transcript_20637/m.30691 type:complete len:759 (-) Transcript_20637:123-2399(-)|eukprot:CAMPEP_0116024782 /NCGR_PEP_ID=MMETSP0321-20121206/12572_1 /TAXON_ID=163516 /ORGANISM="Leptocylindrus danicus var. danicus, Strain B650" /LENGTH=758 /DNA_ID=CAMNT_0003496679 /DNA_START=238 /DNA_END=2514 /DNA_ORIENTATION=+
MMLFKCSAALLATAIVSSVEADTTTPFGKNYFGKKFEPAFEDIGEILRQSDLRRERLAEEAKDPSTRRRLDPADEEFFDEFIAHSDSQTCTADAHAVPFNEQVRGVCLGGWQVLEPWITPSLFYQFLGKGQDTAALDTYTFCEVLGPEEGNKQLRRHWDTWVTEDIIRQLSEEEHINSFRLPVGDWSFNPYGPYVGCTDGSLEYIDQLLDWAWKYNVTVLMDIHTMKDSQNGFDNSGKASALQWTSAFSKWPEGETATFLHWPIRTAEWLGKFNFSSFSYPTINQANIDHALTAVTNLVDRYKNHPAVLGLEPINEPWEFTPIDVLKKFYWDGYLIVKKAAPRWKFVMHDSFRFDVNVWGGFMDGCPDRALDTHIYQAWKPPSSRFSFYGDACAWKAGIAAMEEHFGPVIVGEWSLATDNCAMWLNGFNDNVPGYPMLPCKFVPCSPPYMGTDQPGTPIDQGEPYLGPYGTGVSGPSWGQCPVGRDWMKEHKKNVTEGKDWEHAPPQAPPGRDGTDEVMTNLARKKILAFSGSGHGFYFWNFRTDVEEPEWSYMLASERGWIPKGTFESDHIKSACNHEDKGEFLCVARRSAGNEEQVRGACQWALGSMGEDVSVVKDLQGDALYDEADIVYNQYWQENYIKGATCDFGGTAYLQYNSDAASDDEFVDDWVEPDESDQENVSKRNAIIGIACGVLLGGFLGFFIAMRSSVSFNVRVRKRMPRSLQNSQVFTSRNSLLGSESMPMLLDESDMSTMQRVA